MHQIIIISVLFLVFLVTLSVATPCFAQAPQKFVYTVGDFKNFRSKRLDLRRSKDVSGAARSF